MRQNLKELIELLSKAHFRGTGVVVELGAYQVEGQEGFADLRPYFPGAKYIGCDMRPGPGVDRIENGHALSFPNNYAHWVLCMDTLEHVFDPIAVMSELKRILRPDGVIVVSSVMNFPVHDYPGDYWRFTPEIFWHLLSGLKRRWVLAQGVPENPHTVIGIGSKRNELNIEVPSCLDGEAVHLFEFPRDRDIDLDALYKRRTFTIDLSNPNNSHTMIINRVSPGSRVLELGSGEGHMTAVLRKRLGCNVSCVEVDEESARIVRKYAEKLVVADLDVTDLERTFQGENFDFIICADVLEHLKAPERILSSASRLLSHDGKILISIPNAAHASLALELIEGRFEYQPLGLLDAGHLRLFTLKSFLELLEKAGLAAVSIERVIVHPMNSEFFTRWDEYPVELIDLIEKTNPEFKSYQFVIEAVPSNRIEGGLKPAIQAKEIKVEIDKKRVQELNYRIETMEKSLSWRMTRPLRWLKHKVLGRKGPLC